MVPLLHNSGSPRHPIAQNPVLLARCIGKRFIPARRQIVIKHRLRELVCGEISSLTIYEVVEVPRSIDVCFHDFTA